MKKWMQVVLVCVAVCIGSAFLGAERVEAAEKVVWTTTNLYYELDGQGRPQNVLVIEGYFTNHTDKYINYIYELNLSATMRADIGAGYVDTVKGTFRSFEKMIDPHSESAHTFRITNAKIVWPIEEYEVVQGYTKWKQSDAWIVNSKSDNFFKGLKSKLNRRQISQRSVNSMPVKPIDIIV